MIIEYLRNYLLIMFAMSVDNIFWIPTSPEYKKYKELPFFRKTFGGRFIIVEDKIYTTKLQYILKYRVKSVLTHWRDIVPAILTAGILTLLT